MKKISLLMMTLIVAATMSATVVKFDFSDPTSMGLTPSSEAGKGVSLNSDTITVDDVAMLFANTTGNGAKLWTAKGPIYTLRLYMPSQMILKSSGDNIRGIRVTRTQGDITELDENSEWRGNAKSVTLSVPTNGKANYISMVTVYVGEEMPSTKIDTISVSEARQRINDKNLIPCYIKGVVMSAPFVLNDRKCVWLTDINNPGDSIQGYGIRKGKASTETYKTLDEMAEDFGLQDTVLVYADALAKINATYEMAGGYFVETIAKSQAIDASETFPYSYGAVQMEMVEGKYRYEIVLSKEDEAYDNALHYIIRTDKEKGIVGTYSTYGDSSYVDGYGKVTGSLTIAYVSEGNPENTYSLNGNIIIGGSLYRFDNAQYSLAGYPDKDSDDPFQLVDDVPFVPQEGDTITCAQAASYARSLGSATGVNVYVRGFATGFQKLDGRSQQSPYMADDAAATKGVFQAYLCYTQNRDSIIVGDEIIAYGPVTYYAAGDKCQISKGQIYRIGGSNTQRPVTLDEVPAGAITVADAIALASQLTVGDTTAEVTVKGYVTKLYKTFNGQYSSQSFYMDDAPYQESVFYTMEAFQSKIAVAAIVGDYVFVKGRITKYESTEDSPARKAAGEVSYNIVNSVTKFAELASDIEEIVAATKEIKSKKVLVNGQLYIVQDGVLYNAQGNVVR